jgi:hypothetical protein
VATGKLYRSNDEQFLCNVSYQFQHESPYRWWGELSVIEYVRINDGNSYILELEDKRKSRCTLRKRVNRAVSGIPPRYIYRFTGTRAFE